jgi:hypothetical protein
VPGYVLAPNNFVPYNAQATIHTYEVQFRAHRTPNPGFNPEFTPSPHLLYERGMNPGLNPGFNPGLNPGFGVLRCGLSFIITRHILVNGIVS